MFIAAATLAVTAGQKRELERLVRNGNSPQKVVLRCKALLLAHEGVANANIADQLKISRPTVLALRAACIKNGMTAVTGIRRRKRSPKVLTPELEQRLGWLAIAWFGAEGVRGRPELPSISCTWGYVSPSALFAATGASL